MRTIPLTHLPKFRKPVGITLPAERKDRPFPFPIPQDCPTHPNRLVIWMRHNNKRLCHITAFAPNILLYKCCAWALLKSDAVPMCEVTIPENEHRQGGRPIGGYVDIFLNELRPSCSEGAKPKKKKIF